MKGKKLNLAPLGFGLITSIIICGFVTELFQIAIAWFLGVDIISVDYNYLYLSAAFPLVKGMKYGLIMISPYVFVVIMGEIVILLLKRSGLSNFRFLLVVNMLIYLGFILFNLFLSAISLLFKFELRNDFMMFISAFEAGIIYKIVIIAAIIIMFIKYFTLRINKIESYITNL